MDLINEHAGSPMELINKHAGTPMELLIHKLAGHVYPCKNLHLYALADSKTDK